jgi:hypothetical protein
MLIENLLLLKDKIEKNINDRVRFDLTDKVKLEIYPQSIINKDKSLFFIAKHRNNKHLYILLEAHDESQIGTIKGVDVDSIIDDGAHYTLRRARLNHATALRLQKMFEFTRPVLLGKETSIGLGDRLGLANPGHLRAIKGTKIKAVLAQQSIRELTRTHRKPQDVLDAAIWAVFQEGYYCGFGADADHLKTTQDVDLMLKAGYTMFTIDPSEYVDNEADRLSIYKLSNRAEELPWSQLHDNLESMVARYEDKKLLIDNSFALKPRLPDILRAIVKYGGAIAHTNRMHQYLVSQYTGHPFEIELSVDETDAITSPFDHYFIANELNRLQIEFVSLAPRFIGDFEKGIDYRGDLKLFQQEFIKHRKIAQVFGNYKISFHSGSDKFAVYTVVGALDNRNIHIKTAGTSYLEALRTVADRNETLFRDILDFARDLYEVEKKTYHVSAELSHVKSASSYDAKELINLLDNDAVRQVLHVTFGKVLTERDRNGKYQFKNKLMHCLIKNEDLYSHNIEIHFKKHIEPFL